MYRTQMTKETCKTKELTSRGICSYHREEKGISNPKTRKEKKKKKTHTDTQGLIISKSKTKKL